MNKWVKRLVIRPLIRMLIMFGAIAFMIIVSIYVRDHTGSYTYFEDEDFNYGPYNITIPPYNRTFKYNILLNGHSHTNKNGKVSK